jgi:ABC-type multidrug transport system fused ATPase/permease subunit
MQTVKGFAAEPHQVRRFEEANRQVSDQQKRIFRDLSLFTLLTQVLSQLSLVILFAYGGWLYVQGRIPLGGRAGGVRRALAAVQRAGGQYHDHRELGAAELHGGAPRVRGARHAARRCRTGRTRSCRGG